MHPTNRAGQLCNLRHSHYLNYRDGSGLTHVIMSLSEFDLFEIGFSRQNRYKVSVQSSLRPLPKML